MIKALLLIFSPNRTWDGIAKAQRSVGFILGLYLVPLLAFVLAVQTWGLTHWGRYQGAGLRVKLFSTQETVLFETVQFVLWLGIVFIGAQVAKALGCTFHARQTYRQAFATVAYGLSPLFMLGLLDAFTGVSLWASWGIGICLAMATLYQGIPRVMLPPPPQAFGLYLMTAIFLFLVTGLVRFITFWYLAGKLTFFA